MPACPVPARAGLPELDLVLQLVALGLEVVPLGQEAVALLRQRLRALQQLLGLELQAVGLLGLPVRAGPQLADLLLVAVDLGIKIGFLKFVRI